MLRVCGSGTMALLPLAGSYVLDWTVTVWSLPAGRRLAKYPRPLGWAELTDLGNSH
ncbi:hypothetical protein [Stenotrophomonas phage CM2]